MCYSNVFWDWNGTLFGDATAAWLAVNDMLQARKLPLITFDSYREYIDVPIIRFYEKVMDIEHESMEALSVEYNALWENHLPTNPLAEGAEEMLRFFAEKGMKQYIFSSSNNKMIVPYLERFGIIKYFDAVLGADDCYVGSKVERTAAYIKAHDILPKDTVFIGDMVHDCEVASLIGSDCILVSNGHQSEKALVNTGREVVPSLKLLLNKFSQEVVL